MDLDIEPALDGLFPPLINGKTRQELAASIAANDTKNFVHFVDGVKLPPQVQPSTLEALKTLEVREDDVYLFTFPRSGTHWASEIMHFILNDGREDFDRTFMTNGLELTLLLDPTKPESVAPGYKVFETMTSRRCIGSHCLERFLPPDVLKKAKVIYVARNPKDVLNSYVKISEAFIPDMNFDELIWTFATGQFSFGSWYDHVLNYWKHRDSPNLMFVKYEDLQKDLKGSIGKLAKFVGKDLSDDVIDGIAQHVTFDGMKATYRKLEEEHGDKGVLMTHALGVQPYLRKGKVGNWKDSFTVTQSELFDKVYALKMQGSGLDFDFEL